MSDTITLQRLEIDAPWDFDEHHTYNATVCVSDGRTDLQIKLDSAAADRLVACVLDELAMAAKDATGRLTAELLAMKPGGAS